MKNNWQTKKEMIIKDQEKLYSEFKGLVMQTFYSCMARDVVKEYRYKRASKTKSYNAINTFSHVALENYTISQLWKLFDKKNSVLDVYFVIKKMPYPSLKEWFKIELNKVEDDVKNLSIWRHNLVGHRSGLGYFTPEEFEEKFTNISESEVKIKGFLLSILCQIKFEMQRIEIHKTMEELTGELKSYASFLDVEKDKVLKEYENQ